MDIYLTSELSKYYYDAYVEVKKFEGNPFWKLDEGLVLFLDEINNNGFVKSLYSKKSYQGKYQYESYLRIAYFKEVELNLFRYLLPDIVYRNNKDYESFCYYFFEVPEIRQNDRDSLFGLKCIDDPDYFNVNNIRIKLKSGNINDHDLFWKDLTESLSNLKP